MKPPYRIVLVIIDEFHDDSIVHQSVGRGSQVGSGEVQ
ncbi:hypothetical protein BMMGA3_17225 (plasmid) [Bacillus methanolicus MGA3]|uniref:Uncharacterized protein n=1 Tax=Bacillus methanolicus (strain MGA3 / ATCC 53907) TaxID=796606 RepID=A0A068M233_BACMM|nr:hypothetical protein BMMGA3_17225 [Bacillus methanolicus MGA3]